MRAVSAPWVVAAGAACGCAVVALVDPTEHRLTPPCPFRVATGWWCPFCGATRAVSTVMQGDLAAALRYNLALVAFAPALVALWVLWALPDRTERFAGVRERLPLLARLSVVALVAFTVVRNLPVAEDLLRYPGA